MSQQAGLQEAQSLTVTRRASVTWHNMEVYHGAALVAFFFIHYLSIIIDFYTNYSIFVYQTDTFVSIPLAWSTSTEMIPSYLAFFPGLIRAILCWTF